MTAPGKPPNPSQRQHRAVVASLTAAARARQGTAQIAALHPRRADAGLRKFSWESAE